MTARAPVAFGVVIGLAIVLFGAIALGIMGGYGYGPGTMGGYGYGPGMPAGCGAGGTMYGPGGAAGPPGGRGDLNLSAEDVKNYFGGWIAVEGNPRLKVGDVKEKDADTIEADIVTKKENALVQRFIVDRRTGFYRPSRS